MLHNDYPGEHCSVARSLEVVGERWSLLIVRELLYHPRRFVDLERALGVAKNVLTNRLDKLVSHDVAKKVDAVDGNGGLRYALTEKGRDLFPVLAALMAWGDKYEAPAGPPVLFEHDCGRTSGLMFSCVHCAGPVTIDTVTPRPGPGEVA